jgi:hypothetical protein
MNKNMDREEKARVLRLVNADNTRLMRIQLSRIPQLTIEEQSKSSNVVRYSPENLKKVNHFRQMLEKIQNEMKVIMQ